MDGAEIVLRNERVFGQRHGHRRRDEQVRAFVVLDGAQELGEVEPGHGDQAGPFPQCEVQQDSKPVDVKERQQGKKPVLRLHLQKPAGLFHVGHEVAVAELHAFGPPRGTGGVRQHGHMGGRVEGNGRYRCSGGEQVLQRGVTRGAVEHHEPVRRDPGTLGRLLGTRKQGGHREQPRCSRVLQLKRDFIGGIERVNGGDGGTGTEQSVEDGSERRDVGAEDRGNPVRAQPLRGDCARHGVNLFQQLAVRGFRTAAAVHDGGPVQVRFRESPEEVLIDALVRDNNIRKGAREHATSPLIRFSSWRPLTAAAGATLVRRVKDAASPA
ncbi:hypothetical protein D9M72_437010 [compost metagenome]